MKPFLVGTRGSALALAQVDLTRAALAAVLPGLTVEQKVFVTRGDQKLDLSLLRASEAGGKGLFTKELEDALLSGVIDAAVHSLKDLPGHNPPGLAVTAVLKRAATGDVLIAREPHTFATLPDGSILGTSSVRRARQLRWLRPDLGIVEWRGNVQTRLRKLGESPETAGIILAQAGLERLGYNLASGTLELGEWQFHVSSLEEQLLPPLARARSPSKAGLIVPRSLRSLKRSTIAKRIWPFGPSGNCSGCSRAIAQCLLASAPGYSNPACKWKRSSSAPKVSRPKAQKPKAKPPSLRPWRKRCFRDWNDGRPSKLTKQK